MDDTAQYRQTAFNEIVRRFVVLGLPQDEIEYALQDALDVVYLAPRDHLFAQDAPVTSVYLLKAGSVYQERVVQDGQGRRRVSLRREAQPDEWIGHYDLLYSQRYGTRARALEHSVLVSVHASALNRLLYRYPKLRQQMAPMDKIGRLRTVPLFAALDLTVLSYVADACTPRTFRTGAPIYQPDDAAQYIFIIDTGQVVLSGPNRSQTWLGNGMAFGFLDEPQRTAHSSAQSEPPAYGHRAAAIAPTSAFIIPRRQLIELADIDPEKVGISLRRAVEDTLSKVRVFSGYDADQRATLAGYMSHYHIPSAHLVMQQGEVGDSLWVLMPGGSATLSALEGGQAMPPTVVHGPNFFSEMALRVEHPLNSTVQAEPNSQWLRLHSEDFQAFLRDHGQHLLDALSLSPAAGRILGLTQARRRYSWLQKGENLVIFQRRHWLALLRKMTFGTLLLAGILVLWSLLGAQDWLAPWMGWLLGIGALVGAGSIAWGILDYLNDYLLVTNQRLVRQEKVLFFGEWRKAAFLEQIRNIDINVSFFGNLLDFGDVRIQTAATSGTIAFDYVPLPKTLKRIILEQQNLRNQHYQASSKMVIQNMLEERFGLRLRLPGRVRPSADTGGAEDAPPDQNVWRRVQRLVRKPAAAQAEPPDKIIWRKHWIVLFGKIVGPLVLLVLVLVLMAGGQLLPADMQAVVQAIDLLLMLTGLAMAAWIAWLVADWRNDTYEIDDREIADVEKKPLFFSEQRRTALLGEIENIEVIIPSPLHYLLNFGNVRLQTAASQGLFTFDWVPDPRNVSEEVRRRIEHYRQQQEATRARQRAQELPDWFEMYNRLGSENSAPPAGRSAP